MNGKSAEEQTGRESPKHEQIPSSESSKCKCSEDDMCPVGMWDIWQCQKQTSTVFTTHAIVLFNHQMTMKVGQLGYKHCESCVCKHLCFALALCRRFNAPALLMFKHIRRLRQPKTIVEPGAGALAGYRRARNGYRRAQTGYRLARTETNEAGSFMMM